MAPEIEEVTRRVPRKPSGNDVQRAIRLQKDWIDRADALIPWIAEPGIAVTTTDVLRACIRRGLEAYEAEQRAETKPAKKK